MALYSLQLGLRKSKNDVYKAKDLFQGVSCNECGGTHFRFEAKVKLAGFPFYGYTCLTCGNLVFMDADAMIDYPYLQTICNESVLEHNSNIKLDKPKGL